MDALTPSPGTAHAATIAIRRRLPRRPNLARSAWPPWLIWLSWLATLALCSACGGGSGMPPLAPAPAPATGALAVSVNGLPAGTDAALTVSGPNAYSQALKAGATLDTLVPGSYRVTAAQVSQGGVVLAPTVPSQQVQVAAGATASASVTYLAQPVAPPVLPTPPALALQQVATGLTFPVLLTAPAGDSRQFIVERPGRIRIMQNGVLLPTPFLDIRNRVSSGGERGLLSMAFHPQYASNGYLFIYLTDLAGNINIERLSVSPLNPNQADPASALTVLTVAHPAYTNHYGGQVNFGPDGYLYLATGDGGGIGDPLANAQNPAALLGKMLRIDVDHSSQAQPYAIPADNPFVGQPGLRGEIWAYGLRNPWRYNFDLTDRLLYIADVGQDVNEEVDITPSIQGGNNYGWNLMEGRACYQAASCSQAGLTLPAFEYAHGAGNINGCSITGGYVYRGAALPELAGHYFYADYCKGWLKSFAYRNGVVTEQTVWPVANVGNVLSFGQDGQNELYLLNAAGGVYRIVRQ